ncbi:GDSL-type esterase/lipase family protein [Sporichthya polymorpha]|uniref:GDSL-type esterase/lipase family protein n=1 Tax=Sporichthya polymorpha TaxID=35751 RepID=UPI00037F4655|nr:GDSL-type esterase/lipase family protein [Sporichthya polymorpha]
MSRIGFGLLAAVTAFGALTVGPATINAAPARAGNQPVRLLLTGDSITHGSHGDYTWRYRLAQEFRLQAKPFDFVGSWTSPYKPIEFAAAAYADPAFDQDHFSRAGWQLREMVGAIGAEVGRHQPDVIVLEAGINDLRHGQTADQIESSLRAWVKQVRAAKRDVRIVISPLLPADRVADRDRINAGVADYNARLPRLATRLSTRRSPVTVARTNQGWSPAEHTWDGLHPTPASEGLIARRIAEELARVGVLPTDPQIPIATRWTFTQRPEVTLAGRTVTVRWSPQAVTSASVQVRRIDAPAPVVTKERGQSAQFALERGGVYDVRLRLVRGTMTGPWGQAVTVEVPSVSSAPRLPR